MTEPERPRQKPSVALAVVRLTVLLTIIFSLLPFYFLLRALKRDQQERLRFAVKATQLWGRLSCRFLDLGVRLEGPLPAPGTFIAPNHMGYADLLVLCSQVPTLFVTRTEIVAWPIAGPVIRATEHPHVARTGTRSLHDGARQVAERLKAGQSVCVFLEGTSTGGDRVLPFRTPLLQGALEAGAPVVPLGIHWGSRDGTADVWYDVAYWTKEHEFASHVIRLAGLRGLEATLRFGPPIQATDRKRMAEELREQVCALSGLPPRDEPHPEGHTAKVGEAGKAELGS